MRSIMTVCVLQMADMLVGGNSWCITTQSYMLWVIGGCKAHTLHTPATPQHRQLDTLVAIHEPSIDRLCCRWQTCMWAEIARAPPCKATRYGQWAGETHTPSTALLSGCSHWLHVLKGICVVQMADMQVSRGSHMTLVKLSIA